MKLLIITQKVDKQDPVLGFFHSWVFKLSEKFEKISVICLEKGEFDLQDKVRIYSLGKESGGNKIKYAKNFFNLILGLHKDYHAVFVHMNQEYVLLGWFIWKILKKKIYFWRNHGSGNLLTRIAVALSDKVFCTSEQSFTAKFKKTVIMPVGIDTEIFKPVSKITREKHSVCMVGRISPLKHIDKALAAINHLAVSGTHVSFNIAGPVKDLEYYEKLKKYIFEKNLSANVYFTNAVAQNKLPEIYSGHEVCINLSEPGMFDKTIVEAAACGALPLVSDSSFAHIPEEACIRDDSTIGIAASIQQAFKLRERTDTRQKLEYFVESHSLSALMEKLYIEIK
ncbi:MAG: glycosyltransferase family 4 protein [Patescibacteria group bacterium]